VTAYHVIAAFQLISELLGIVRHLRYSPHNLRTGPVQLSERRVDIILTAGGTGPDVRDVTPEATRKVLDREFPGLAEAMRAASSAKTPNAWLSRAVAGIRRETLIVNLPGSKKAAVENLEAILPVIPHAVKMLRNETTHPESDAGRIVTIQNADAPTLVVVRDGR